MHQSNLVIWDEKSILRHTKYGLEVLENLNKNWLFAIYVTGKNCK